MISQPPEIIVFGGTFDPPHLGHRLLIRNAAQMFGRAKILVVPNPATPDVSGQMKAGISASFRDRLEMCRLAFEDMNSSLNLEISDLELQLGPPNYSYRILQHLCDLNPGKRLAFLMGQDQAQVFDKWQNPKRILELADLIVVGRQAHPELSNPTSLSSEILRLMARMGVTSKEQRGGIYLPDYDRFIYLAERPVSTAQSSLLRSDNESMNRDGREWLCPAVREYISKHKLYQVNQNGR